jgi:hypothetical protein
MGTKKQASGGSPGRAKLAAASLLDRAERVRRGQEVLDKVKNKANDLEAKRAPDVLSGTKVSAKTLTKYENEEIANYAFANGIEEPDVRVDVQLAKLVNAIVDADLENAVTSGRLRLTKPLLDDLVKLINPKSGDDLERRVRELLDEQI